MNAQFRSAMRAIRYTGSSRLSSPRFFTSSARPSPRSVRTPVIAGTFGGIAAFILLCLANQNQQGGSSAFALDAPTGSHPLQSSKTVIAPPSSPAVVATGNTTVPALPLTLNMADGMEYSLVGFGVRTVSFLRIQVYVAGYYVATADLPRLSAALIAATTPSESSSADAASQAMPRSLLLPGAERTALQTQLLDGSASNQLWDRVLQDSQIRSAFRIIPVRDTDFHHLRDGFVRAIQARTRPGGPPQWAFGDAEFGEAMREFRNIFNRGKVPKQKELLLLREANGELRVLYDDGLGVSRTELGVVKDERVSRMLWLNYLGGSAVASESARKSICEGLLDLVSRPIGSV
ncbi:Altered inheritance of mitochondria protein 18 mitochondrial [Ceratocystis platani]|uniref:Altered inheritance of mitochondria protein 18 mitochondrial n=1 Tax=Ceratocystis fimbriata f. sp. platani TaxID=88771 RepID=A0A0F8BV09_CERFI|nr:Altered inheritance of mitochondria protein 18 mitochondrial [Ceratocystis platani]